MVKSEQVVTKGVLESIDNYTLQKILILVGNLKLKSNEMIELKLNKCSHCDKQRIYIVDNDRDTLLDDVCFFTIKSSDAEVIIYNDSDTKKVVICLLKEAQDLVNKKLEKNKNS